MLERSCNRFEGAVGDYKRATGVCKDQEPIEQQFAAGSGTKLPTLVELSACFFSHLTRTVYVSDIYPISRLSLTTNSICLRCLSNLTPLVEDMVRIPSGDFIYRSVLLWHNLIDLLTLT